MLTMVHSNGARIEQGVLRVDRKFLTGMRRYAEQIEGPLMTIHPEMGPNCQTMDLIEVSCKDLGFEVMTIKEHGASMAAKAGLHAQIARSSLMYGSGLGSTDIAKRLGIPYIMVLEYDLRTQIVMNMQVPNLARRGVRSLRSVARYVSHHIPAMRGALALHCNGYPIYDEARLFNANRLLYLDSRMSANMVIPESQLESRLQQRSGRPLRLLFSGRYERVKGADDSVRVAIECLRRGLNIELHTYGQGDLREKMLGLALHSSFADRIHIHDSVTYPELIERSRECDLFVCCHIQSDPSCSYLESFGAGLPIVGYANRMWDRLSATSLCGAASALGKPAQVADHIACLLSDDVTLGLLSKRARAFALAHTFEHEFSLRTDALKQSLARIRHSHVTRQS